VTRLVNIVRRGGTYHFRRVVPAKLRCRIGRRELIRTLDTNVPAAAKLRADLLYRASERLLAAAASPMLSSDLLARLVQDFYNLVLDIDHHRRVLNGPISDEEHSAQVAYLDELLIEHKQALGRNRFEVIDPAVGLILNRNGMARETLGSGEINQIYQACLRASIDLTQHLRARYEGDFAYEPKDKLLMAALAGARLGSQAAPLARITTGTATAPSHASTDPDRIEPTGQTGVLFAEIGKAFRIEQAAISAWDAQTASQAGATYRLFVEVCGNRPLQSYTRADADLFRKQVQRLPATYSKTAHYRGLTVPQILKRAEAEAATKPVELISQKTVKRHFSALSALWTSAVAAGTVKENIFAGFRFATTKLAREQRPMWTPHELRPSSSALSGSAASPMCGEPSQAL
jgi:hypothetical protein